MITLRRLLENELLSMAPRASGRRKIEKMLARLTVMELIAATGVKIRLRVKAGRRKVRTQ